MSIVTVTKTQSYTVDWAGLAQGVERLVLEKLKADLANWKKDISMKQMLVQDAADSLAVCELLLEGNWQKAENRIRDMDTAARDHVFDFVAEVAGEDFFKIVQ
jgi:hypothetical protein